GGPARRSRRRRPDARGGRAPCVALTRRWGRLRGAFAGSEGPGLVRGARRRRVVRFRLIAEETAGQTFVLVFETGDEAVELLGSFAREQGLSAAQLTGIGAFSDVVLGYFDWEQKDYRPISLDEQVEVVALLGDVALQDGEPVVHAHVVVARSDGAAYGGH